jgi:ATP-binding cassette subfamily F protein uup
MSFISLEGVDKTYGDRKLLDGITFLVGDGERVGLVGPNGCGKSTLLRLLAGDEVPDEGKRIVRRGLRVGYLPQEPWIDPDLTIREAARAGLAGRDGVLASLDRVHTELADPALGGEAIERLLREQARLEDELQALGGHDIEHRVETVLHGVGLVDLDARCGVLSGGERRRVALARLLIDRPDLLLLDEPTNHLDAETIDWLEDLLLESAIPLVLVTHDRYFLDRVVTRIVEVDRGVLHGYDGAYREYVEQRAARLEREARSEATRLNLLRRETAWIRRGAPARTTKARARIDRYEALVDAAPETADRELAFEIPCGQRLGEKVISAQGLGKSFGDRRIIQGLDLELGKSDRLGIVGPNGAGKSTLIRLLMGELEPDSGVVDVGPTVAFSYIDQKREGLSLDRTVIEEVGRGNDHIVVGGRAFRIESFLDAMLFPRGKSRTKVGDLSGGERSRVQLAKLLATAGNVLILDEPTNDLDLTTLQVLEEAVLAFAGAVIVVSHDRWFLDRIATRVVHLDGAGQHRVWNGELSFLLERMAEERRQAEAQRTARRDAPSPKVEDRPAPVKSKRLSNWEERELAELPEKIEAVEGELAALDVRLADPSVYSGDPSLAKSLTAERAGLQEKVDALLVRWEELESRAAPGGS